MAKMVEVPEFEVHERVAVDPAKTALIIVDMQNDFVKEGGTLVGPHVAETVPVIENLLKRARDEGMKVVYSQDTHADGDPEWDIWPEHCREGTWGAEIIPELTPRDDEMVIGKVRYDAFYGTNLDHMLRVWKTEMLIICGTVASICVHYTAASAALRWYEVVIPRDAVSALEEFDLEASLRQTTFLFSGKVAATGAGIEMRSPGYLSKLEEAASE